MYDTTHPEVAALHKAHPDAQMVAGYIAGNPSLHYTWTDADFALWPSSTVKLRITPFASVNDGDVLDVENGDATPQQTHGWIKMRQAAGYFRPNIYCSLNTVPLIRKYTAELVLNEDYALWTAHYTGEPHIAYPGESACQYADPDVTPGKPPWDTSQVHDPAWPYRTSPLPRPSRHVADGKTSLIAIAAERSTTTDHLFFQTMKLASRENTLRLAKYIILAGPHEAMPAGMVYWTSQP